MAMRMAHFFAFAAQLEQEAIARLARAGIERARTEGKRIEGPPAIDEGTLTTVQQGVDEGMPVAAARRYGMPTTLIRYLDRIA